MAEFLFVAQLFCVISEGVQKVFRQMTFRDSQADRPDAASEFHEQATVMLPKQDSRIRAAVLAREAEARADLLERLGVAA